MQNETARERLQYFADDRGYEYLAPELVQALRAVLDACDVAETYGEQALSVTTIRNTIEGKLSP